MRDKLEKEFLPSVLNIRNECVWVYCFKERGGGKANMTNEFLCSSSKHSHHAAMAAQGGGNGETREQQA